MRRVRHALRRWSSWAMLLAGALSITVGDAAITGRWDIALRDLDFAIGLDADGDGNITWGEVRARHADIASLALSRLAVRADGAACSITAGEQAIDDHTDGAYTVIPLRIACPQPPARLGLSYSLFAELDPQHRGLLNLQAPGLARTAVLGPQAPSQQFDLREPDRLSQFIAYAREGVVHIWIGYDHILFLLSLLLPAALLWQDRRWQPAPRLREPFWDVVKIVTSFTVAHSITLSLAALGAVALPSRWVESAIAASVALAALNNLFPLIHERRWMVAFGFGWSMASALRACWRTWACRRRRCCSRSWGFNVGVEAGQLAIVGAFLPLAFQLRRTLLYRRLVFSGGSLLIAAVAAVWLGERVFDVKVLPF